MSCGTCAHWAWGYEGEGECTKWPEARTVVRRKGELAGMEDSVRHYEGSSTCVCDDWNGR